MKNGYEMQCILSTRIQRESHWQPGFHLSPNCSSSHNSFPRLPVMKTNIFLRTVLNFFETRWVCRDTIKKSGNVMFLIKTRCCSTNPPVIIYALFFIFWISWFTLFFAPPRLGPACAFLSSPRPAHPWSIVTLISMVRFYVPEQCFWLKKCWRRLGGEMQAIEAGLHQMKQRGAAWLLATN